MVRFKMFGTSFVLGKIMHTEKKLVLEFDLTFCPGYETSDIR